MNVLSDLRTWLISSSTGYAQIGPGLSTATVYLNKRPASTGNFIVIRQYGGLAPTAIADGTIDNPRVQVELLTAVTSDSGYKTALAIQNRLRFVSNMWIPTSTGDLFLSIDPLQSPNPLGTDENNRMQWVQNFQIKVSYN